MTLERFASRVAKFAADNAPAILAGIGVAGVITTAILTAKASFRARDMIVDEWESRNRDHLIQGDTLERLTTMEQIKLVWPLYIPPVLTGALACTAIVCSNRMGTQRAALLAGAYTALSNNFEDYKAKLVEVAGKNKAQKVHDEIAQDRVNANPPTDQQQIIFAGSDLQLFKDAQSGRYFTSTVEDVRQAENKINYCLIHDGSASLTEYYYQIGLESTKESDEFGWRNDKLLELKFSTAIIDGKKSCIVVDFSVTPVRDYWRMG